MSKKWANFWIDLGMYIFIAVFLTFCAWLVIGCSPKVITVPEYHYEKEKTTDTITMSDTVISEKNTIIREADSTMLAELGVRLKHGERAILILQKELEKAMSKQKEAIHDTVVKVDSIRVPYPVEKQVTKWEKIKFRTIIIALFIIFPTLLYSLFRDKRP